MKEQYLAVPVVAQELGISKQRIYRAVRQNKVKHITCQPQNSVRKTVAVLESEIKQYFNI